MGLLILFLILAVIICLFVYFCELNGDLNNIIKSGLVTEYFEKHNSDDVYVKRVYSTRVLFNKLYIEETGGWFVPYKIYIVENPKLPTLSQTEIGSVVILTRDWWTIQKITKMVSKKKQLDYRKLMDLE